MLNDRLAGAGIKEGKMEILGGMLPVVYTCKKPLSQAVTSRLTKLSIVDIREVQL
jgi:hypothetical protein